MIQIREVNTKKCNIVKSSAILKDTMLIYVQLDCKWHQMKGVLPFKPALSHILANYIGKGFGTAVNDPHD